MTTWNRLVAVAVLILTGCASRTNWEVLEAEIGRSIADVTLVAGTPDRIADLPGGRRIYEWSRWHLVPRGGGRCIYRLHAVLKGQPQSLAAWRVVAIEPPAPGCGPLDRQVRLSRP